jgi:uncharacterized peroxidase-related enzyme
MSRVTPLSRESLSEFEPLFSMIEQSIGFVPNSMLTMGRWPQLLQGFSGLVGAISAGGTLPRELKQLVAFVSSNASGCRYCQAHTSHGAEKLGVPIEKIESAFEYETSPLFDASERAALRLAQDASIVPSAVTDEHFERLREHFDDQQIVELVAQISLFGWLNRWNDTLSTTLEPGPLSFGEAHLEPHGWSAGGHEAKGTP